MVNLFCEFAQLVNSSWEVKKKSLSTKTKPSFNSCSLSRKECGVAQINCASGCSAANVFIPAVVVLALRYVTFQPSTSNSWAKCRALEIRNCNRCLCHPRPVVIR